MSYATMIDRASAELHSAAGRVDPAAFEALLDGMVAARRIVLHGNGREGLMIRALAMRLYHLGLDVHMTGDMACPPVGPGDLLLVTSGPGHSTTMLALLAIAARDGARTACITAQASSRVAAACDTVLVIPAQTMADDRGPDARSLLPMGSLFEGAEFLVFEILILTLRDRLGTDAEAMRARHTNME